MSEMTPKRQHALNLMRHKLNRRWFEKVLMTLREGGIYGWPDQQEVFTKEEIRQALANPEDYYEFSSFVECIKAGAHLQSCDDDGYCNYCGHQEVVNG